LRLITYLCFRPKCYNQHKHGTRGLHSTSVFTDEADYRRNSFAKNSKKSRYSPFRCLATQSCSL
jgi:hypothetical protein